MIWAALHTPELRDPRGYIIPSDQADFRRRRSSSTRCSRRTSPCSARRATSTVARQALSGRLVRRARPRRRSVRTSWTCSSRRIIPNVIPVSGRAADAALRQRRMDARVPDGRAVRSHPRRRSRGRSRRSTEWNVDAAGRHGAPVAGALAIVGNRANDAFIAVNRLLEGGETARRAARDGAFVLRRQRNRDGRGRRQLAATLGVTFRPSELARRRRPKLRAPRIGLWDQYGGSMTSGWTRWILEQFEFPFERVFAPELDAGNLNAKYDVLVFVDGAIPAGAGCAAAGGGAAAAAELIRRSARRVSRSGRRDDGRSDDAEDSRVHRERRHGRSRIGSSATNLAAYLKLPIENQLVENGAPLPRTKFYVPGSVLTGAVDTASGRGRDEGAHGLLLRQQSGVQARPGAASQRRARHRLVRHRDAAAQRLGVGPEVSRERRHRRGGDASARDSVLLFGPEILQRAQPHGTFKLLFNAIFSSVAR